MVSVKGITPSGVSFFDQGVAFQIDALLNIKEGVTKLSNELQSVLQEKEKLQSLVTKLKAENETLERLLKSRFLSLDTDLKLKGENETLEKLLKSKILDDKHPLALSNCLIVCDKFAKGISAYAKSSNQQNTDIQNLVVQDLIQKVQEAHQIHNADRIERTQDIQTNEEVPVFLSPGKKSEIPLPLSSCSREGHDDSQKTQHDTDMTEINLQLQDPANKVSMIDIIDIGNEGNQSCRVSGILTSSDDQNFTVAVPGKPHQIGVSMVEQTAVQDTGQLNTMISPTFGSDVGQVKTEDEDCEQCNFNTQTTIVLESTENEPILPVQEESYSELDETTTLADDHRVSMVSTSSIGEQNQTNLVISEPVSVGKSGSWDRWPTIERRLKRPKMMFKKTDIKSNIAFSRKTLKESSTITRINREGRSSGLETKNPLLFSKGKSNLLHISEPNQNYSTGSVNVTSNSASFGVDTGSALPSTIQVVPGSVRGCATVPLPKAKPGRFKCNICQKDFSRKDNLQTHQRIHTGEKPFVCTLCGSQFSVKGNLIRHKRIHGDKKIHLCIICSQTFSHQTQLEFHVAAYH